jgi:ABC-type transport system involved in cytochrome bd biosynthesis fused ATPase/permease subunit
MPENEVDQHPLNSQSDMIVDQVSEVIDHIPEDELLDLVKSVNPSNTKHAVMHRASALEDYDMIQAESNAK